MPYAERLFWTILMNLIKQDALTLGEMLIYTYIGSILVFGTTDQHSGDKIFPMFGDMGAGYGSTLLNIPSSNNQVQSLTLKCYPSILHHLKATVITMDLPNTNSGM